MIKRLWSEYRQGLRFSGPGVAIQHAEVVIASARAFMAIATLIALQLGTSQFGVYESLTKRGTEIFVVYSFAVLLAFRNDIRTKASYGIFFHVIDTIWAAYITLFTQGPNSQFFPFLIFVVLAAAYRWGLISTLATSAMIIGILLVESRFFHIGFIVSGVRVSAQVEWAGLVTGISYTAIIGSLIGYLSETEKEQRANFSQITNMIGRIQEASSLQGSLQNFLHDLLGLLSSDRALLVINQPSSGQCYLWAFERNDRGELFISTNELLPSGQREHYLFVPEESAWYVERDSRTPQPFSVALYSAGRPLRRHRIAELPMPFRQRHPFSRSAVGIGFQIPEQCYGAVFVLDPKLRSSLRAELTFLVQTIRQVAPVINSTYLLTRIRSQAGIMERARVSREVHDGVIPTFSSGLMRLEAIRQTGDRNSSDSSMALSDSIAMIKEGVTSLREVVERTKPLDFHPRQLPDFIAEVLRKFQQEASIQTRFAYDLTGVPPKYRMCHEVARIVQEALVNVRRHSGATHVSVDMKINNGRLEIVIADDGRGFSFSGRVTSDGLSTNLQGPIVIQQRVRSLRGELTVESFPGMGSRLEILLPANSKSVGAVV